MKLALAALLLFPLSAPAEDFPGGPGITPEEMGDELRKGFGADAGMTARDGALLDKSRFDIGGQLWSEFNYAQLSTTTQPGGFVFNPNTLWLYGDARLQNDVRGFVKFRAIYDPTADETTVSPFTGTASQEIRTILDELKLQFHADRKAFFTVGRQKIRWGTGKFWNPTDVLNNQRFDFRFGQDIRPGVAQIKTHVPIGASNFYLIQLLDDANRPSSVQHALRAEVPVETAEISASALFGGQQEPVYGVDASSALWDLDIYGEIAHSGGARQAFYDADGAYLDPGRSWTSWTAGVSYDVKYSDQDAVTFGLEYFRNGLGYASASDYLPVLLGGGYQPFYLGRQYGMFLIYLPAPGRWQKTDISLFNLANLSDKSALTRLDLTTSALEGVKVTFAVGLHYGREDGELRLGGQRVDGTIRLMTSF